jgi:hypothetical protein
MPSQGMAKAHSALGHGVRRTQAEMVLAGDRNGDDAMHCAGVCDSRCLRTGDGFFSMRCGVWAHGPIAPSAVQDAGFGHGHL